MNKPAIQKFAIWARNELISQVSQRAYQYGIDEKNCDASLEAVGGRLLSAEEKSQRRELVRQIEAKGYTQVMEEVAYTWFNRFIALRFMEVNNYLPSHIRVFSDGNGAFKPEILSDALHVDLPGLDTAKVAEYIEANDTETLYRYLLLTQCNALNEALPMMFERMGGYTEMLLPNNILKPDGVLGRMVADIPEDDWRDAVQIIGWLYQYYNDERKNAVINIYKGTVKKEDVPAATQLFTTDWVVRYMVDNSLGRYWIERHPESRLADCLQFLVTPKSGELAHVSDFIKPEDIKFFDPCMGSGHVLVYAFDVLMEIYKESGYTERDAAGMIVRNNLFGLDIDERAAQMAYLAVMMKARQYDRRFLTRGIQPNVYAPGSYEDGQEYGSMLQIDALEPQPEVDGTNLFGESADARLNTWNFRRLLAQKYDIVVTNPPYLNKYNPKLKDFVNKNYKDYSGDLFSVFIYRNLHLCKPDGYCGYMTPFVWMFIKTYEKLREYIIKGKSIATLVQMEYSAFEEATVPICSFVLKNGKPAEKGLYFKLSDFKGGMEVQKTKVLEALADKDCGYFYEADQSNFSKIPGSPVAYWVSEALLNDFSIGKILKEKGDTRQGMATSDNNRFLRLWHEVSVNKLGLGCKNAADALACQKKWYPYNKGGEFRKWYGNIEYTVNYEKDGYEIKKYASSLYKSASRTIKSMSEYFKPCLSWSKISSGSIAFRYYPDGFIFDVAGCCIFYKEPSVMMYDFGFLNSAVAKSILSAISPTLNYEAGHIASLPVIQNDEHMLHTTDLTQKNIEISKADWDSYETSWDFKRSPLI